MIARLLPGLGVLVAASTLAGCVFTDTPPPRYFAPPSALLFPDDPPIDPAPGDTPVRVRRVRAAGYLGQQMVWRVSDVERGLYEQRRWSEFPTRYLDRALVQALERTPGVRSVDRGQVATIDLELVSFDEVIAPSREAEVAVWVSLKAADQSPVFDRVFTARQSIADTEPSSTARAMGAALDDAVKQIADQVAVAVRTTK